MTRTSHRRGANAIEFALCVPFLFLMLGAVIDGGTFLLDQRAVAQAAHAGARVGASTSEPYPATGALILAAARTAATSSMTNQGFAPGDFTVQADWYKDTQGTSWLEVSVTCEHDTLFGGLTPFDKDLSAWFISMTQEQ
jgi:Flp pilus assembly protein TadG